MSARPGSGGPPFFRRLNMGQIFIGLAVVSGLITLLLFKSLTAPKMVTAPVVVTKTKPLVIATQQLLSGELISAGTVKVVDWPEDFYPTNASYTDPNKLLGRVVKTDIYPGEPVYRTNLAGEDSAGGLPVVIPPGYRAMTILVDENKGVGGFIKPGDHVDIVGNFEYHISESSQKSLSDKTGMPIEDTFSVTQTVLQDVQVLAIAQDMYQKKPEPAPTSVSPADTAKPASGEPTSPTAAPATAAPAVPGVDLTGGNDPTKARVVSSVTVAVTPEDAEKLSFADGKGHLRLTLRPENEHKHVALLGSVTDDVVPMKKLYEKDLQLNAEMEPLLMNNAAMSHSKHRAKSYHYQPMSAPSHVELIEGSTKSNINF